MSRWVWLTAGLILGVDWSRRSVAAVIGMGKIPDVSRPEWDRPPRLIGEQPSVTVVVPARNEEKMIEQCLRSLLAQDYPNLEIYAVDDRSTDATGAIMNDLEKRWPNKLRITHVTGLPAGWLGKTHAMWRGAQQSKSDWLLFTDGDVLFRPDALLRTIAYAELTGCDHLVMFPTAIMKSWGESMMLAFFHIAGALLLRPWKARDPRSRDVVGVGAFNLIRRSAYEQVGTYQSLRMEVIDDLKLGEAVKRQGFVQDCIRGRGLIRLHWAEGAFGIVKTLQKNLFSLFRFSWPLATVAALAAILYHLGPWIGLLLAPSFSKIGFAAAAFSIFLLYVRTSRDLKIPIWFVFTQPVAAITFFYTLLNSALSAARHGGVLWRGTVYRLEEIRAVTARARTESAVSHRRSPGSES